MEVNGSRPVTNINQYLQGARPVESMQGNTAGRTIQPPRQQGASFDEILDGAVTRQREVKLSRHAEARLTARGIPFGEEQRERLANAVDKAAGKGLRDPLVVLDDVAMVVNVANRTVVTAVSQGEMKESVFTNIDGAVFG